MSVGMKKNKPNKKIFFFNGVSLKLIWILLLTRFFSYNIYVFDISRRKIELKLLQKLHKLKLITRITDHNTIPFDNTHSSAIDLSNKIINKHSNNSPIQLARILFNSSETDLVFKKVLVDSLCLVKAINFYIINNVKNVNATLFISNKYSKIIKENPKIMDSSICIKYTFDLHNLRLKLQWFALTLSYFLHLFVQPLYRNSKSKKKFKYAISVPFPWAAKFKGGREFTLLIDNKKIKKDDSVFLVEYKEKKDFYDHYKSQGYFIKKAQTIKTLWDLFKQSNLKIQNDFWIIAKLLICLKRDSYIYESLIVLLSSRISWAIISNDNIFKNYIYFNKEGSSQISTNILLKSRGIKTHAYSQFIGGMYQVCGQSSIFDKRNILWSFLNPNYYYLNNQAMIDSMALHHQERVSYRNIGNIFSEKIVEIRKKSKYTNILKKNYGVKSSEKIISIFDTSYVQLKNIYSNYDEAQYFLKDVIRLAKTMPNYIFLFKPSKDNSYFLSSYWADEKGKNIIKLRNEFDQLSNAFMLSDKDDVIDIISLSKIVFTNSFSSPTADALMARVPAFWYQAKTDVSFSVYNKVPGLIVNGYEDLSIQVNKMLQDDYPVDIFNNFDFMHLVGDLKKSGLTSLRVELSNA